MADCDDDEITMLNEFATQFSIEVEMWESRLNDIEEENEMEENEMEDNDEYYE